MFNRYGFHTGYIKTIIKTDSVEEIAILNSLGDVKKSSDICVYMDIYSTIHDLMQKRSNAISLSDILHGVTLIYTSMFLRRCWKGHTTSPNGKGYF